MTSAREHVTAAEQYLKDTDRIIQRVTSGKQSTLILADQILVTAMTASAQLHLMLAQCELLEKAVNPVLTYKELPDETTPGRSAATDTEY